MDLTGYMVDLDIEGYSGFIWNHGKLDIEGYSGFILNHGGFSYLKL